MTTFRADLHCHSTCSDGSLSPSELLKLAVERGLKGLSITDHDSVCAYPQVLLEAEAAGIKMVTGVEFSTDFDGEPVHLLAYAFHPEAPGIEALCSRHADRRYKRNAAMIGKLQEHGMDIDSALIDAPGTVGRPHIAKALIDGGFVSSYQEAFKKWIGDNCPCFVRGETVSTEETLDIVKQSGGIAVLAHPHLIKRKRIVTKLCGLHWDGIECYYAVFGPKEEQPWAKIAAARSLLATGGSDFHGDIKPFIPLGASWVNEETFSILETRFRDNYGRISTAS